MISPVDTLLPVNTDPALSAPGGPGTYLPHVTYTQFFSDTAVIGGLRGRIRF